MSHRRLLPLDGMRGLAVLLVFFFHVAGGAQSRFLPLRIFGLVNKAGWCGVSLFFLLSGFLITGIVWDSRGREHWWRNFYARRMLRIFPLYYFCLLLVLAGAALAGTLGPELRHIWSPALFLQDIPGPLLECINVPHSPLSVVHLWSLAVEEQFYLVWPLLLVLQRDERRALRLCVWTFVLSEVFRLGLWTARPGADQYSEFVLARAGEMAAGAWLAIAYRTPLWNALARPARWIAPAGLAVFAVSSLLHGSGELRGLMQVSVGLPALTLCFAALLVLALHGGRTARVLSIGWLRWLGGISYGIYMYHRMFLPLFGRAAAAVAGSAEGVTYMALRFVVTAAGTLIMAWLSFRFFEQPILRNKLRFPTAGAVPDHVASAA